MPLLNRDEPTTLLNRVDDAPEHASPSSVMCTDTPRSLSLCEVQVHVSTLYPVVLFTHVVIDMSAEPSGEAVARGPRRFGSLHAALEPFLDRAQDGRESWPRYSV